MSNLAVAQSVKPNVEVLRDAITSMVPAMQDRAVQADALLRFPSEDIDILRNLGALSAPMPTAFGGLGIGTEPQFALALADVLRLLGRGNLSLGRLYEAHVNAVRLVVRTGNKDQVRRVAADASQGHLFGLWVTDTPDAPLRMVDGRRLVGDKAPCSGAGHATRALVNAALPDGRMQMLIVHTDNACDADDAGWDTHGMRGAANGRASFNGFCIRPEMILGQPGDYLRQPDFSAGAWRTSAVTLGGLEALVATFCQTLAQRGRDSDPYQKARIGHVMIALETARLWVRRAAVVGESDRMAHGDIVNIVNMARLAVEAACLDVIQVVQRGLGMASFLRGTLVELLYRDLAMYLRQPAPDETLADVATHFAGRDMVLLP